MFSILLHVDSLCCSQPLDYLMMGPIQMEKYKFEDRLMERSSHKMWLSSLKCVEHTNGERNIL